jgi:hypothetical protein
MEVTLGDLLMAIGLMFGAGGLMVWLDKGMSERELLAYHLKQNRKRLRAMRAVAK